MKLITLLGGLDAGFHRLDAVKPVVRTWDGATMGPRRWGLMDVDGILRAKGADVVTIRADATIRDLVRGLRDARIGAMVVCNDGRTVLGIISERDVVRGLAERGSGVLDVAVADLMTRQVTTCTPDDSVKHVMAEMTKHRIRHIPVIANDRLVGIVSIGDVVKNRLGEMETEANILREAYIAGDRRPVRH